MHVYSGVEMNRLRQQQKHHSNIVNFLDNSYCKLLAFYFCNEKQTVDRGGLKCEKLLNY